MWKKYYTREKDNGISSPVLIETTYEGPFDKFPTPEQARATLRSPDGRSPTPGRSPISGRSPTAGRSPTSGRSPNTSRSTTPVGAAKRRFSNLPILSGRSSMEKERPSADSRAFSSGHSPSIYTQPRPEMQPGFEAARPAPLFSTREKPRFFDPVLHGNIESIERRKSRLPISRKPPPGLGRGTGPPRASFAERAAQNGVTGIAIPPAPKEPWSGASGQTAQLTPITDAGSSVGRSRAVSEADPLHEFQPGEVTPVQPVPPTLTVTTDFGSATANSSLSRAGSSSIISPATRANSESPNISPVSDPARPPLPGQSFAQVNEPTAVHDAGIIAESIPEEPPSPTPPLVIQRAPSPPVARTPSPPIQSAPAPPMKDDHRAISVQNTYPTPPPRTDSLPNYNEPQQPPQPVSRFSWTTRASEAGPVPPSTPGRPSFETMTMSPQSTPPRAQGGPQSANTSPAGKRNRPLPVSRFSWTTTATETSYAGGPRPPTAEEHKLQSPPTPPRPTPAEPVRADTSPSQKRRSLISARSHPLRGPRFQTAGPTTIIPFQDGSPLPRTPHIIKRKPTPSITSTLAASPIQDTTISSNNTPADTSKTLPLSPPSLASIDLITLLQAQLDDLNTRRRNLQKVIDSLHVQPGNANPVVQDLAARKALREKREAFEKELAETLKESHEVGLRLHRAWKRRDQEAPTGLWVRRVTN